MPKKEGKRGTSKHEADSFSKAEERRLNNLLRSHPHEHNSEHHPEHHVHHEHHAEHHPEHHEVIHHHEHHPEHHVHHEHHAEHHPEHHVHHEHHAEHHPEHHPEHHEVIHHHEHPHERAISAPGHQTLERELLHNIIELQKVHTSLAEKFDKLTKEISSLLNLFEVTAKSFAQSSEGQTAAKDSDFLDKIDKLLEQNKTLAKGITLMEERIRGNSVPSPEFRAPEPRVQSSGGEKPEEAEYEPSFANKPLPKF